MHETRPTRDQGQPAPLWLREHTFTFHQRPNTPFPWLELRHQRLNTEDVSLGWRVADWYRSEWSTPEQGQQRCLNQERPHSGRAPPQGHLTPVLLYKGAVTLLSYSKLLLFSQPCCVTTEFFALNKVPFFTCTPNCGLLLPLN